MTSAFMVQLFMVWSPNLWHFQGAWLHWCIANFQSLVKRQMLSGNLHFLSCCLLS